MATTTQDLAVAVQEVTDLTRTVTEQMEGLTNKGNQAVERIKTAYLDRMNTMLYRAYINQTTGSDDNDGSRESPLKSINKAVETTPPGGVCEVLLLSDYYIDQEVFLDNKKLTINTGNGQKHELTFRKAIETISNIQYRRLIGITNNNGGAVRFIGIKLIMPELVDGWELYPASSKNYFVNFTPITKISSILISMTYCDIVIPATPFAKFFSGILPIDYYQNGCVVTPADGYKGNLFGGIDAAAGTDVNQISWLSSNLTHV